MMLTNQLSGVFVGLLAVVPSIIAHGHGHSHDEHESHHHAHANLEHLVEAANSSLLWGTYRPQLYHGIRPRLPNSLMTGLMWHGLNDYKGYNEIRHTCEDSDHITSYTYTQHDGRSYAKQELYDGKNNVKIVTSFLKGNKEDGTPVGGWAVRVEGESIDPEQQSRTSLIYHIGQEGLGSLTLASPYSDDGLEGEIVLNGMSPSLGEYRIRIIDHPGTTNAVTAGQHASSFLSQIGKTSFLSLQIPTGSVWRIKDLITRSLTATATAIMPRYQNQNPPDPSYLFTLGNKIQDGGNLWAFQKVGVGKGVSGGSRKWGFDVVYEPVGEESKKVQWNHQTITRSLMSKFIAYNQRFEHAFQLPAEYLTPGYIKFAQSITSNLLGGIGYFHGDSIIDRSFRHGHDDVDEEDEDEDEDEDGFFTGKGNVQKGPTREPERELLTATPSRSFFPRGFYWDEGFHLAIIGEWDNDLSLEILKSWINLIDKDGWVGREQILGDEARSKVPQEFQTQYPSYANPPTIPMAVTSYIRRLKEREANGMMDDSLGMGGGHEHSGHGHGHGHADHGHVDTSLSEAYLNHPELASSYLKSIYPSLRRHYLWFRRTQKGQLHEWGRKATSRVEAYRWRGRTEDHVLTSGLDDYPRATPPHPGELHVDLMSWMGFFARTMGEVAEYLGEEEDLSEYTRHERGIKANLEELHWSEKDGMYCDLSVDADDESIHVCHPGYISLFPFLLQLTPASSSHITPILDLLSSPNHLWSEYGIRSLSASHPLFGKGENYWRGPIWIQMNWMVLKALKEKYMVEEGPERVRAGRIYGELRRNVVENVYKEFERTGYVWEQYDAKTGEGKRSHPFTGWTSLVIMIMTEKY